MPTQQKFLDTAAKKLGLTPEELAKRMGAPWDTFRKWIAPVENTTNHRPMPEIAWRLVREILAHEELKSQVEKPVDSRPGGL